MIKTYKSLLLIPLCMLFFACTSNKDIDYKNIPELTQPSEMMSYFDNLVLDTTGNSETASVTRYFDGSWDLEYEYEQDDESRYDPMYYSITIEAARSEREARESFIFTKGALRAGNRLFGTVSQEVEGLSLPGDQNYYATLHNEYGQIGIIYVTRHNTRIYSLILSGIFTDDNYILEEIIIPELYQLSSFEIPK